MQYFAKYFSDVDFTDKTGEVKVSCPFHQDNHPSASINVEKDLFHCWVCGVGYNEQQFISHTNDITMSDAAKVLDKFRENQSRADWFITEKALLWAKQPFLDKVKQLLKLSDNTIESLDLGVIKDEQDRLYLGIPVIYNGVIMDTRRYNVLKIQGEPKMKGEEGAKNGWVIPYDIWKHSTDTTYVMEGEKDMMLARELGINAITLTGGAGAKPNDFVINTFKDRNVVICYDNDDAGEEGRDKLYLELKSVCKSVKYVNVSDVVKDKKEDFFDMIVNYGKDEFDFFALKQHDFDIKEKGKNYIPIKRALKENIIKQELITDIVVTASFEDTYAVPKHIIAEKIAEDGSKKETMFAGETKTWYLEKWNIYEMLALIELDAKKKQLFSVYKSLTGVSKDEPNVSVKESDYATVYKLRITDKDTLEDTENNSTIDLYAFKPMTVGKQYEVKYRIYPHPTKNQKLVGIATDIHDLEELDNFHPNQEILNTFKGGHTSVKDILEHQYQSAKHYVAKHLNYNLWLLDDLVFNSVLEFDYGDRIRGALDVFILGDTQVGKSETVSKLIDLYQFGKLLSLKTSTTVGLIGGSNKVDGSYMNTIGAIPKQHRKLVALEEFSGAKPEFISTSTDMRSSGYLRLARAAGELTVPCRLRMITLSNPINDENGNPRHLSTFPNGVLPLMELIKSAEDVARYDGFLLMSKPKGRFNPFQYTLENEPIPMENYKHKINWVYTRKPENVKFANGVESYIWEKSEELNAKFESNFPLFGTTTSLKLARFSVALAALIVNTDSTYENIVVTKEIVDFMCDYFDTIYDNDVFKLREYKEEHDSYNTITKAEQQKVQFMYMRHTTLFEFLNHQSVTSRANLQAISGLEGDKFNPLFNSLVKLKLIRISSSNVFPTEKFRLAMQKVDKAIQLDTGNRLIDSEEGD